MGNIRTTTYYPDITPSGFQQSINASTSPIEYKLRDFATEAAKYGDSYDL